MNLELYANVHRVTAAAGIFESFIQVSSFNSMTCPGLPDFVKNTEKSYTVCGFYTLLVKIKFHVDTTVLSIL